MSALALPRPWLLGFDPWRLLRPLQLDGQFAPGQRMQFEGAGDTEIHSGGVIGGGGTALTWDSALTTADHTLSVGDTVVDFGGLKDICGGILPKTSGKWYAEVVMTVSASTKEYIGIIQNNIDLTIEPKQGNGVAGDEFWMYQNNGEVHSFDATHSPAGSPTATTGAVIAVAVDIDGGKVWFAINNTWTEGAPAAGTGASFADVTAASIVMAGAGMHANTQYTIRAEAAKSYSPPSGFTYWS